ncbi:MAG: alpha/beta hydrolase, partial [Desulfobulbaceae bacterium]|nr:alpha/beta hydrolase [Desulfobulbaceae bacterium]
MPKNIFTFTDPGKSPRKECFVFLPGWGFPGRVIELATPRRAWLTVDDQLAPDTAVEDLADFLDRQRIDSIVLVGWSLGAYLAVNFMLRYPERVKALYLLAMRRFWPPTEIEGIRADLTEDPVGFMKSFYRKCFLGHPSDYRKFRASFEGSCLAGLDLDNLEAGLGYLQDFRLNSKAEQVARLNISAYVLHGAKDIIAPPAEMAVVPGTVSRIIKSAGHPVFLDQDCPLDWHH